MNMRISAVAIGVIALGLAGCKMAPVQVPPNTLVATMTSSAPSMDAVAVDAIWAKASPLTVTLADGANFGAKPGDTADTKVTLKAVYTADMLYMLIQYADPTHSVRRGPYQKQADGTWKKLTDPADKGGDDNIYYEDKWAMMWPIDNSIKTFDKEGCAALCHLDQGKPYGNKYTAREGEMGDIWHMKGQRTAPNGFVDDQYVDHTRYVPKVTPNAGRKNDPGTQGGEYNPVPLVNGVPQFMSRDAKAANTGGTYFIKRGEEVAFDNSRFKTGDEVASIIINPLLGDRGDVRVAINWSNGTYTSVVSRKLVTGSKYDVQFSDLAARYGFGFAAFDNAQVRHATADDPLYMVFAK